MNKARKLLDKDYVLSLFKRKILPLYPDFNKIDKIKIISHKKNIWISTYHIVFEYRVSFSNKNYPQKRAKSFSFFVTAHSNEPRKNVHDVLTYLWDQGFSKGYLLIPKPLFYSKYFNASFYRGVQGENLLQIIKRGNKIEIEDMVKKTAQWLVKLHRLKVPSDLSYNKKNNKIKTVLPGYQEALRNLKEKHEGKYFTEVKKIYDCLIELEEDFFNLSHKEWLVHGDVHPENIIKISDRKIAFIDFADLCVSDFARDLGTFVQQLDYKLSQNNYSKVFINKVNKVFLEIYCQGAKIKYNARLEERIKLYYSWTALRSALYWLLKHEPQPDRADSLLLDIKKKVKIK